jgi:hypothetical protein
MSSKKKMTMMTSEIPNNFGLIEETVSSDNLTIATLKNTSSVGRLSNHGSGDVDNGEKNNENIVSVTANEEDTKVFNLLDEPLPPLDLLDIEDEIMNSGAMGYVYKFYPCEKLIHKTDLFNDGTHLLQRFNEYFLTI